MYYYLDEKITASEQRWEKFMSGLDYIMVGLSCLAVLLVVAICVGAAVDIEFMRSLVN